MTTRIRPTAPRTSPRTAPRTALVLGTAVAAALMLGACSAGTDSGTPSTSSSSGAVATQQADAEHNGADVMFAQMMVPHHEQAVQMSDLLLAKEGIEPEVAELAEQIMAAQAPEIETMNGWLEAWGIDPDLVDHSQMDHVGMDGVLSNAELKELEAADTEEATRLYLEGMIAHHEGAVTMAEAEVADGAYPPAIELAEAVIAVQEAEIEQMRGLLGQGPTAAGSAGAQAPGDAPETALAGDQEMLADHGLDGLDVRELIEHLDTQAVADRPADLVASVQPDRLLVADDSGRQTELPMPRDAVYVSAAPYVSQTHDCHFHSLTTCRGELASRQVQVRLVDADTGDVVIDEARTTFDNGFVGMWVPRGISGELTIEHEGCTATSAVSTRGSEDATCLTELQLRRG